MSDFALPQAVEILRATPGVARALLAPLSDDWTTEPPDPAAWSAADVVRHLIANEKTNFIVRARTIRTHGETVVFPAFDHDRQFEETRDLSVPALLDTFERLRAENVATLERLDLTDDALAATGTHPAFGRVTLAQLIATWAAHDLNHVSHAVEMMAKRYREAVGPWRVYLPILDRAE